MMDEFKALEKFENDCRDYFEPEAEEFTFKQEALHRDFVKLMESFCEKYIRSLGRSLDFFYEAVREQMDATSQGGDDARECMEVLFEMSDLRVWVAGMKMRVRYRAIHDEPPMRVGPPKVL